MVLMRWGKRAKIVHSGSECESPCQCPQLISGNRVCDIEKCKNEDQFAVEKCVFVVD